MQVVLVVALVVLVEPVVLLVLAMLVVLVAPAALVALAVLVAHPFWTVLDKLKFQEKLNFQEKRKFHLKLKFRNSSTVEQSPVFANSARQKCVFKRALRARRAASAAETCGPDVGLKIRTAQRRKNNSTRNFNQTVILTSSSFVVKRLAKQLLPNSLEMK